jgi:hypothetical protein
MDLVTSTIGFSIALAVTFIVVRLREDTVYPHDLHAAEAFYWLAILFTFALVRRRIHRRAPETRLPDVGGHLCVVAIAHWRFAERGPGLLDRLHRHATARRLARRFLAQSRE